MICQKYYLFYFTSKPNLSSLLKFWGVREGLDSGLWNHASVLRVLGHGLGIGLSFSYLPWTDGSVLVVKNFSEWSSSMGQTWPVWWPWPSPGHKKGFHIISSFPFTVGWREMSWQLKWQWGFPPHQWFHRVSQKTPHTKSSHGAAVLTALICGSDNNKLRCWKCV